MNKKNKKNKNSELLKFSPESFSDSKKIAEELKNNNVVLVNFDFIDNKEILRIIDFISGVLYLLEGKYKKISSKSYLLSPSKDLIEKFADKI